MKQFTLEIKLGNEAMRTSDDVAHALKHLGSHGWEYTRRKRQYSWLLEF